MLKCYNHYIAVIAVLLITAAIIRISMIIMYDCVIELR